MLDDYGKYRANLMTRILTEAMTPIQVGRELGEQMERFPSIQYVEVRDLMAMGDTWHRRRS